MTIRNTFLFFSIISLGCTNQATKVNDKKTTDSLPTVTDNLVISNLTAIQPVKTDSTLGKVLIRTFEGKSASSSQYTLIVLNQEYSGDGQFSISIFDNLNKKLFVAQGKRYTLRGENDTTLWQFVTNDDKYSFEFLVNAADSITLVKNPYSEDNPILKMISSEEAAN